ncbi:hypothetical protein [Pontibacter vulgaris]|uniref:hypothetical protein n=1 Tax=Pontibacter vulgaris TaxID=2905679 RepID=UPI001FA7A376|nr:hypothetical protein [Pontibacter vulgaris]
MPFQDDFTAIVLEEHNLICTAWLHSVNSAYFREAMLSAYQCIKDQNLKLWLIDSSMHNPIAQDQKWQVEELGQLLQSTSLKKVALVHNDDLLIELVGEIMIEKAIHAYGPRFELQACCTVHDALEFLLPGYDSNLLSYQLKSTASQLK